MQVSTINKYWLLLFCFLAIPAVAQEYLNPFPQKASRQGGFRNHDTLCLPFYDDFYYGKGETFSGDLCEREGFSGNPRFPSSLNWSHNGVLVYPNFSNGSQNLGSLVLDGANNLGQARVENVNATAPSDTITSHPIYLDGLFSTDSIILSFRLEHTGIGNAPENFDSLSLEFKSESNNWITAKVWKGNEAISPYQYIALVDSFLYDGFQFRFTNVATITGINDHWVIDQVYLDEGRRFAQPFNDIGFSAYTAFFDGLYQAPKSYLQEYFTSSNLNIEVESFNQTNATPNVNYRFELEENCTNTLLENFNISAYLINPFSAQKITAAVNSSAVSTFVNNTVCDDFELKARVIQDATDDYNWNDTLIFTIATSDEIVYDDGTAEAAYGITGNGTKQAAVKFPSFPGATVYGVSVHFAQQNSFPTSQDFSFMLWEDINVNGGSDVLLGRRDFSKVIYSDSIDGFATYLFDSAIDVSALDSFYLGWFQLRNESLNFGFDLNTNHASDIYYYASNTWRNTGFQGTVMIRPVFNADRNGTAIIEQKQFEEIQYKNKGFVVNQQESMQWKAYSIDGKLMADSESIEFKPFLTNGIYIITAINPLSGVILTKKVLIND